MVSPADKEKMDHRLAHTYLLFTSVLLKMLFEHRAFI